MTWMFEFQIIYFMVHFDYAVEHRLQMWISNKLFRGIG
jgi:hypothetical protein